MDRKTEAMIALGAAYAINCHPCMEIIKEKAIRAGVTPEAMRAAIKVGEMVKNGAHEKTRVKAEILFGDSPEAVPCAVESGCSCGNA